ncbi:glycosyltransferase family 2 protein [Mariprofundus sp. KV]|uniref:glycosyltransferase family 2 protein n=1 Tax=Mariprofundus sp. KV TaxID=2608715 RepID=UPI0015A2D401|nr:glycosyltransferase family 2 protein [Mariprofundus sp. KV]NWF36807.1 glycosyltransferase [Mariprofundus sp. KV]
MSQPEAGAKLRIGELLVSRGLISSDQLQEALDQQQAEGGRLGDILLSRRAITTVAFYDALTDHFRRGRIGDLLVERELITEYQLQDILETQKQWGTRFGDIILAKGLVKPFFLSQVLADHFDKPNIDMLKERLDTSILDRDNLSTYSENLFVPWRRENGLLKVAVVDVTPELLQIVDRVVGEPFDFVITSKFDIIWTLQEIGNQFYTEKAVHELANIMPQFSASEVFTPRQLIFVFIWMTLSVAALALWPINSIIALNLAISIFLLLNFALRMVLTWVGGDKYFDNLVTDEEVNAIDERTLPVYSILLPMYHESATLPNIAQALRSLDYPLSKLDIKLILEQDDDETIETAKELGLEGIFEIIRVPESFPRTKPKACNYALHFCRGELATIYDGEDAPEPDQLKKVVIAFQKAPENTAVIQARLNYFNVAENWLTRMFTMEYSLWFDFYLPALDALRIPIPLGGTSNHFKMNVLREMQGWDPYNVTEDCDLGVRLTQRFYRVGVVNSTTYEEANNSIPNWIRQRSRWLKGYMQSYLVHMRAPLKLYGELGHIGFWGFQFFIGGTIVSALVTPILFLMYILWLITQTMVFDPYFPSMVLYINLFNLLIANGFLIYLFMLSGFKRRYFDLIPWALTVPFYWILQSWAGYKGLWQLIHNPFYWEKTHHGLTTFEVGHEKSDVKPAPAAGGAK